MLVLRSAMRRFPLRTIPIRRYASSSSRSSRSSGRLSSIFFNTLLVGGLVGVSYGLYDMYFKPLQWPEEVRDDLRAGIKAKQEGDLITAQSYLERAYLTSKTLPPTIFSPYPYLKITGIAISLSHVYDLLGNSESSYNTLVSAHALQSSTHLGSPVEKMRSVAVSNRLGEMSGEMGKPLQEQEKWLVGSVNELLNLVKEGSSDDNTTEDDEGEMQGALGMLTELDLPSWMDKQSFGAPFEALGEFYSKLGKVEYAMPLYLQAISILIPPPPHQARSDEDICRGAQLMSNISELLIRHDKSSERLIQAATWAARGLSKIQTVMKNDPSYIASLDSPSHTTTDTTHEPTTPTTLDTTTHSSTPNTCETALILSLFNNAAIAEYQNDIPTAKRLYQQSLVQAERVGMKEGVREAGVAVGRLDRGEVLDGNGSATGSSGLGRRNPYGGAGGGGSGDNGWSGWVKGLFVGRG